MKVSGLCVLFMVMTGTALCFLTFSSSISSISDELFPSYGDGTTAAASNRKLKEKSSRELMGKKWDGNTMVMEDYQPNDPVPSSKASIRTAPIEHGSPIIPYIPKPAAPPSHPEHDVSP